jgi:hypothetical protein
MQASNKASFDNAAPVKLSLENLEDYVKRTNAMVEFFICINIAGKEFYAGARTVAPAVHVVSNIDKAQRYSCDEANELMRTLWVNHAFPVYSKIAGLSGGMTCKSCDAWFEGVR